MPIRYMGTKRHMAHRVREAIASLSPSGAVVDLFGGMGSVAEVLAPDFAVYENDFLRFATVLARARLTNNSCLEYKQSLVRPLEDAFGENRRRLQLLFARRLARERSAIEGGRIALSRWLDSAPHVASSAHYGALARLAANSQGSDHFQLITLYYSAGYFSTEQAIELDAIRAAVNTLPQQARTPALAAWLLTAARLINSPGHTAQHLRPNSDSAYSRIKRGFLRSAWAVFEDAVTRVEPLGTSAWRNRCRVFNSEAHDLLRELDPGVVGVVYADPPYTKDQYSRFYHVYETMARYDYPGALGRGRTPRADRPMSQYSRSSRVVRAFRELFGLCKQIGVPIVLSYPESGLLKRKGWSIESLAAPLYSVESVTTVPSLHSTMGGSKGTAKTGAAECVFVLTPCCAA